MADDLSEFGAVPVNAPDDLSEFGAVPITPAPQQAVVPGVAPAGSDLGGIISKANATPDSTDWEAIGKFAVMHPIKFAQGLAHVTAATAQQVPSSAAAVVPPIAKNFAAQGIDTVGTAGGAVIGGLTSPVTGPVGPMAGAGGGNYGAQRLNMALGLQDKVDLGQVAGSALTAGGSGPISAPLAAMAGTAVQSGIDTKSAPTPGQLALSAVGGFMAGGSGEPVGEPQINALRTQAQDAGYAFDPVSANPSLTNRLAGSFGGTAAIKADASLKNQVVTNAIGAQEIGLPGVPLTQDAIDQAWTLANAPMQKLAAVSPQIAQAIQDSRQLRYDADNANYQYSTSQPGVSLKKNPALQAQATAARSLADNKETQLASMAQQAGVPDLYTDYVAGRVQQAKVGAVDENFDPDTNTLSAQGLGKLLDKGVPLTDGLRLIADTHNNFGAWMKDGPDVVRPGSNKLNFFTGALAAREGYERFGTPGLAAGVLPFMDAPARGMMLSPMGQSLMAQPARTPPGMLANMARYGVQQAANPVPNPAMAQYAQPASP